VQVVATSQTVSGPAPVGPAKTAHDGGQDLFAGLLAALAAVIPVPAVTATAAPVVGTGGQSAGQTGSGGGQADGLSVTGLLATAYGEQNFLPDTGPGTGPVALGASVPAAAADTIPGPGTQPAENSQPTQAGGSLDALAPVQLPAASGPPAAPAANPVTGANPSIVGAPPAAPAANPVTEANPSSVGAPPAVSTASPAGPDSQTPPPATSGGSPVTPVQGATVQAVLPTSTGPAQSVPAPGVLVSAAGQTGSPTPQPPQTGGPLPGQGMTGVPGQVASSPVASTAPGGDASGGGLSQFASAKDGDSPGGKVANQTQNPLAAQAVPLPQVQAGLTPVTPAALPQAAAETILNYLNQAGRLPAQLQLHLDPPALGKLTINLSLSGGALSMTFITAGSHARDLVAASLPQMREVLGQHNLAVAQADVMVGSFAGGTGQDGGTPQQGTPVRTAWSQASAVPEPDEQPESAPATSLVNILV